VDLCSSGQGSVVGFCVDSYGLTRFVIRDERLECMSDLWLLKLIISDIESSCWMGQDMRCAHCVTLRRVCVTAVAVEMQYVLHVLSVCLCIAFGTILSSVACPALQYFFHIIT
jgi:hypothetical protein